MNKWGELFDKELMLKILKKIKYCTVRLLGPFLIISIFANFYFFSIEASDSMLPTIRKKDLLFIEKENKYQRGDIICFKVKNDIVYLKRIVGLPNEIIEVDNGFVYIDGEKLIEDYIHEKPSYYYEPNLIPENSYFVLGDNRNNSEDSILFGFVSKENIKGKVKLIINFLN